MKGLLVWGGVSLGVVVALLLAVIAIGAMLPVAHHISKSETFAATPGKLFDLSVAIFHRTNHGMYAITQEDRPRRLVTTIIKKNLPFGGSWTYDFAPDGTGTKLTITENGEIYNPFFRFVSRFVLGYEGSIDAFFAELRKDTKQG